MKKIIPLFFLFIYSFSHAQWNTTVNSPAYLSPSSNGNISYSILQQRFNMPSTDGLAGKIAFTGTDGNFSNGLGFIHAANIASPLIWMYNYDGTNAFTIARKNYSAGESTIADNLYPLFQVRANGNVGIGTTDPKSPLQIGTYSRISAVSGNTYLSRGWYHDGNNKTTVADPAIIGLQNNGILFFTDPGGTLNTAYTPSVRMMIRNDGNVGVGTETPGYKLTVNGTIGAKKVKVTPDIWPDYVFDNEYKLPTLDEVREFIRLNKHLPGVPSAKEVAENDLDVGDTQAILLKKIEELTLYMIQLKVENEKLAAKVKALEEQQQKK